MTCPLDKDTLKVKDLESDTIIKGEFVAGMISKDLLSTFKIPILMTLVTKTDFIDL